MFGQNNFLIFFPCKMHPCKDTELSLILEVFVGLCFVILIIHVLTGSLFIHWHLFISGIKTRKCLLSLVQGWIKIVLNFLSFWFFLCSTTCTRSCYVTQQSKPVYCQLDQVHQVTWRLGDMFLFIVQQNLIISLRSCLPCRWSPSPSCSSSPAPSTCTGWPTIWSLWCRAGWWKDLLLKNT